MARYGPVFFTGRSVASPRGVPLPMWSMDRRLSRFAHLLTSPRIRFANAAFVHCTGRTQRSVRPFPTNYALDGSPDDPQVEPDRPVPHVIFVEADALFVGGIVASGNLPEARNAR